MLILLQWVVPDPAALIAAGYDEQAVYDGATPLTRADQRLPLVADVERYCLEVGGAALGTYSVVPVRSSDWTAGPPIAGPVTAARRGYCTVADVRAEGFLIAAYPDARVQEAIDLATEQVDRLCGWRFDPHRRRVALDVDPDTGVAFLREPCIAVWRCWDDYSTALDRSALFVYNRHLTQGPAAVDDRGNPRVALRADLLEPAAFTPGLQRLVIDGVWGYTELDGLAGETARGSQVPLTYGSPPRAVRRACLLLTADLLATLAAGGSTAPVAGRLLSETTRDQSYTLQALPAAATGWGGTGNAQADGLLRAYRAPPYLGAI